MHVSFISPTEMCIFPDSCCTSKCCHCYAMDKILKFCYIKFCGKNRIRSLIKLQLEMLLIPNALCWSSRKCNCACALPAEVQLRLWVTRRSWQKLFAGKNFVKMLVTAQPQLRSYSKQQRAFGNSNICNWLQFPHIEPVCMIFILIAF